MLQKLIQTLTPLHGLAEARAIIRNSVELDEFVPENEEQWREAYKRFQTLK